jgi:hypothetical protein
VPPSQNYLTNKAPYKGLGADSEEKHEPVSDIDTVVVDSLKVLDPERPIREADSFRPASAAVSSCNRTRPMGACKRSYPFAASNN